MTTTTGGRRRRARYWGGVLAAALTLGAAGRGERAAAAYCPLLDAPHEAWAGVHVGYVLPSDHDAPDWDRVSAWEVGAWGMVFYGENRWGGDLEIRAHGDMVFLQGLDGFFSFYGLTSARLVLVASQRFDEGFGLRVDVAPGVYAGGTAFGRGAWTVPFGAIGTWALTEDTALFAGLSIRPGFTRWFDPRIGLRWVPTEWFHLDAAYPESLLRLNLFDGFAVRAALRHANREEFGMGDDPRRRVYLSETRATAGVEIRIAWESALEVDVGYAMNRRIGFAEESPTFDLDPAMFLRLGWSWRF